MRYRDGEREGERDIWEKGEREREERGKDGGMRER